MLKRTVLIDQYTCNVLYESKSVIGFCTFFFILTKATTLAPTKPTEMVAKDLIYALVFGILVVILASGVAYLMFKLKRRKLALLFVKVSYL